MVVMLRLHGTPLKTRAGMVALRLPKDKDDLYPLFIDKEIKFCKQEIYFQLFLSGCFPLH